MGAYEDLLNRIFDESETSFLRQDAILKLAKMKDPRVFTDLLRACAIEDKDVRHKAIEILLQWKRHSAFDNIVSALDDEDEETRRLALEALGNFSTGMLSYAIEKGSSDKSWIVRRTAEDILEKLKQIYPTQAGTSLNILAESSDSAVDKYEDVDLQTDLTHDVEPKRWMISPEFSSCSKEYATETPPDNSAVGESEEHALVSLSQSEFLPDKEGKDAFDKITNSLLSLKREVEDSLEGPCAILRMTHDKIHIPTVGRLIAKVKKVPLYDVTREINISKGFLAKNLDANVAREVAQQLEEMGIPVSIIEMKEIVKLSEPAKVTSLSVSDDYLVCEAHSWEWGIPRKIRKSWDDVALITCGRLEIRRQRIVEIEEDEEQQGTIKPKWWEMKIDRKPQEKLVVEVTHKFLIDIFFRKDNGEGKWGERIRIGDDVNLENDDAKIEILWQEGSIDTHWAAKELHAFADRVPISYGVKLLARSGETGEWDNLTFVTKKDFDAYNSWLLQLVKIREK